MSRAASRGADDCLRTVSTGRLLGRLRAVSRGCLLVVEVVLRDPGFAFALFLFRSFLQAHFGS